MRKFWVAGFACAALACASVPAAAKAIQRDGFAFPTALLHNKVMDSLEESVCIGGRDAQTDTAEVPHDQLVRI